MFDILLFFFGLLLPLILVYSAITKRLNKDRIPPYCTTVEDAKKDYRKFDDR